MFQPYKEGKTHQGALMQVRKLGLAVAVAALALTGCSDQTNKSANNQAKGPAPAAAVKKAPSNNPKPAGSQTASAKPAARPATNQAQSSTVVARQSTSAKQVNASSKAPVASKSSNAVNSAPTTLVALPKGTVLSAKLGEGLTSSKNHAGDTFAAVLTSSVKLDGKTVIPKGTHVTGRVVTVKRKNPELTVALASVDLNGKSYKLATEPIAAGKSTVKADAGNGDPATAAKEITVPAERRLKFKLAKSVKLPTAAKS